MSDAAAETPEKSKRPRVNVRRPDVMERVAAEVAVHFHSSVVEKLKDRGGKITIGNTTVLLAQQFGFCYGVERAIEILRTGIVRTMKLLGVSSIHELDRSYIDVPVGWLPGGGAGEAGTSTLRSRT